MAACPSPTTVSLTYQSCSRGRTILQHLHLRLQPRSLYCRWPRVSWCEMLTSDHKDVWLQFNNILSGNWLSFCAGRNTIDAMDADDFPASLFIHNGMLWLQHKP